MSTPQSYMCRQCREQFGRNAPVVEGEQLIEGRASGGPSLFHDPKCWPPLSHADHEWRELRRGFLSTIRPNASE